MSRILDRRSALRMGLLTTMGLGALSRYAEASTDLQPKNKVVVGRWFTEFWGKTYNPAVVDELAAPDMVLRYSLHRPRRGHEEIKMFMHGFRDAFPDLNFWGTAPLLADGGIQERPLMVSWQAPCRQHPVGRYISQASPYCGLTAAGSSKRSDSMMG